MAATKTIPTKLQQEQTRAAIQTTQLVKRLQNFALGLPEANSNSEEAEPVVLDSGKLKAIEILLRKSLPDLSAITLSGDPDNPIRTEEVGAGAAKLSTFLESLAERSGKAGATDAE